METSKDKIVVIGAGIIGLSCAFLLIRSGHRVVLVDANAPGSGCSTGNAGHIATELVFPLASPETIMGAPGMLLSRHATLSIRPAYALRIAPWLLRYAWASRPEAYRRGTAALMSLQASAMDDLKALLRAADASDHLVANGSLLVVERQQSLRSLSQMREKLAACGVPSINLDAEEITERAQGLGRNLAGGLYFPKTGHVTDPKRICDIYAEVIAREGGEFIRAHVDKVALRVAGGFHIKTHSNEDGAKTISADRIIVAAGVGSAALLEPLEGKIPLDTERGYALTFSGFTPKFTLPVASYERNIIMSPLDCGLRVTGGVEFGGVDAPPTKARIEALKHHVRELASAPSGVPAEVWMGRRPSLPDYLPAIGESHRHRGLFYAFGHQHLGLTLSAVTATIIAALIEGTPPQVCIQPFRLERFSKKCVRFLAKEAGQTITKSR
ncbi:MAG: FAD-dependent oxidoreductase [Marinicaulis sp.]|nr:FAD-dependent oxidoreductase [Marinicaulis sp.]